MEYTELSKDRKIQTWNGNKLQARTQENLRQDLNSQPNIKANNYVNK
jgi:hypothetical protein